MNTFASHVIYNVLQHPDANPSTVAGHEDIYRKTQEIGEEYDPPLPNLRRSYAVGEVGDRHVVPEPDHPLRSP
ncbi:hypothetical protein KIN20_010068 [Parelaphostrongylus tenuis]|uniref:Uncharacterized protein n=1 Tax=Parelaphostrongylus tenuis TaxID=148309 RepID=A0AAD5QL43_PARTN|nr:hypothetical protein KIN20_010068 [Parelaphostrongylus tenuis]